MQIHLNQDDIEQAIKSYVSAMGVSRPVEEINFTVKRADGQSITAEIELENLSNKSTSNVAPIKPETPEKVAEPVEEESEPEDDTETKALFGNL